MGKTVFHHIPNTGKVFGNAVQPSLRERNGSLFYVLFAILMLDPEQNLAKYKRRQCALIPLTNETAFL